MILTFIIIFLCITKNKFWTKIRVLHQCARLCYQNLLRTPPGDQRKLVQNFTNYFSALKEYSFVIWQSIFQKISRKSQISIWLWKLTHCEKQGLRLKTLAKNKIKILASLFIFKKKLRNILDMHVKNYNKEIRNLNNPFHWKFNLKEIFSMSCFSEETLRHGSYQILLILGHFKANYIDLCF